MYVPLRVFSHFSIGFSSIRPEEIANFCAAEGLPAVAVSDFNTVAGGMETSKALIKKGIQPLSAATVMLKTKFFIGEVAVFAKSAIGHAALLRVINTINTEHKGEHLPIEHFFDLVGVDAADLILLTGGQSGLLYQSHKQLMHNTVLQTLQSRGFEVFVEIERNGGELPIEEGDIIEAASQCGLPLIATSRATYLKPEMQAAHDAYLCIVQKSYIHENKRVKALPGMHICSAAEMALRFSDLPNAVANTLAVARKCNFIMQEVAPRTPSFPVEQGVSQEELLRQKAYRGLSTRLSGGNYDLSAYQDRLAYEIDVIIRMGFAGYFLIVADFIGWAKDNKIPVGPGRGSGAGSLAAYALGITDIDPLPFGLLFERFLNPERVSLPDFDVDFCRERRDEVIQYVREKYGHDHVAHIAAYGTLQARAVLRAVGRVMQLPYNLIDGYARMIPANPANPMSLSEAMQIDELRLAIDSSDEQISQMFSIAVQLEGLFSHVSTHAAGVIISDTPISEVVPVHLDQNGLLSTSYEMKATEAAGLVKFDFLGLKNLDVIDGAKSFIEMIHSQTIDFAELDYTDAETYRKLATGDGFAVFQLESAGMCKAMRELEVDNIHELTALISLYRPGPMEQIPRYAAVKSGQEEVAYLHPELEAILAPTYGVMIYQEQVMQIARSLAGYTLGDADMLRRAMGKKIVREMNAQRERFVIGAEAGWVDVQTDDGRIVRMHALTKLPTTDGTGRMLTLHEACAEGVDVALN